MDVLIIDNYDSYTYNLFQLVGEQTGKEPMVHYNDKIDCEGIRRLRPDRIIISPGPGNVHVPRDRGNVLEVVRDFHRSIPILGICMGHQLLAYVFDGNVVRHDEIMHGKISPVNLSGSRLFAGIPSPLKVMRYHSWVVKRDSLPGEFDVISTLENGVIMGIEMKGYPAYGLQFHPESVGTESGKQIIANFLAL